MMSQDPATNAQRPLSLVEQRVLGVLIEKQKTTDTYPLTLNSLTVGCNQKSNRNPVLDLGEDQVEECLAGLQRDGLVVRVISGRVDKWRHRLYDAWGVSSVELAILAELLLRGPQTEGELRLHASRMDPISDLETLRSHVATLAQRGLVTYLGEPGRRGSLIAHGFHDPVELQNLRSAHSTPAPISLETNCSPNLPSQGSHVQDLAELKKDLDRVGQEVAKLRRLVERICQELGLNLNLEA
jgi:uncharacterized protein YceH (UPF0502 family)